jgi:hypothetical protein
LRKRLGARWNKQLAGWKLATHRIPYKLPPEILIT